MIHTYSGIRAAQRSRMSVLARTYTDHWCGQVGTTKGGKTRRVPMTARLAAALQAIRHLRGVRML